MNTNATISCSCGCFFFVNFQKSSDSVPPKCPQCKTEMNAESWKSLRKTMAELADYNYHILKWNAEHGEPKMLVPAITIQTFDD